jgi:hypothetical protein
MGILKESSNKTAKIIAIVMAPKKYQDSPGLV